MKFTLELQLNKSRAEVWSAFDDPENKKIWQPTVIKFENISGTPGRPGAVSKLTYSEGGREFSLVEKVIHRAEPDRFDGFYENDFADNTVRNSFIPISENKTLWKIEAEFKFKTIIMKIIGPLMKRNYVTRTQRDMERFKNLVEGL